MRKCKRITDIYIYIVRTYPVRICLFCFIGIAYAMANVALIFFNTRLLETITLLGENPDVFSLSIKRGIVFLLVFVVGAILNAIFNYLHVSMKYRIVTLIKGEVFSKIDSLPPISFENPHSLELIEKAKMGADIFYSSFMTILSLLFFYIPYIIILGNYLYYLNPFLIFLLVLMVLPALRLQFLRCSESAKNIDKSTPFKRKYEYFSDCISNRKFCKETRLFNSSTFFKMQFNEALKMYSLYGWKFDKTVIKINLRTRLFSWSGFAIIIVMLFFMVLKESITIAVFSSLFMSLKTISGLINEIVVGHMGLMIEDYGIIKKLILFMELPEKENSIDKVKDIFLDHVYFKYPKATEWALNDINLVINKPLFIAVVGENGSGKSTMAKILSGLYSPVLGKANVFDRQYISAVFQDFNKYPMSLSDNIRISDWGKLYTEEALFSFMIENGLSRDIFLQNINTQLGREFGGVDLSGGEWQRVAIARGFYKEESRFLIFDEPTASIDPFEEDDILELIFKEVKRRTVLFITHRMSTVKKADIIIVMKEGSIAEAGTFKELMIQNGYFKSLYEMQSEWYTPQN